MCAKYSRRMESWWEWKDSERLIDHRPIRLFNFADKIISGKVHSSHHYRDTAVARLRDFTGHCWERRTFYKVVSSSHFACLVSVFLYLLLRGSPCSSERRCMPVVCLKNDSILDRSRASRLHLDSHRQSRTRIRIVSLAFILRREFVNSTSNGVHFTESICTPISLSSTKDLRWFSFLGMSPFGPSYENEQ